MPTQRESNARYKKLTGARQTSVQNQKFQNIENDDYDMDYMDHPDFSEEDFINVVNKNAIDYPAEENITYKLPGEPLFNDSKHTIIEFSMAITAAARQKNLTDAAVNTFLDLFRIFLPSSNKVPSSYNKIKNTVTQNQTSPSPIKEIIKCCGICSESACSCGQNQTSMLVIYDMDVQFLRVFKKLKATMDKYRASMLLQDNMMDAHQAQQYRKASQKYPNMLPLSLYTDGGRYTENGAIEGWPLIASILDLPPKLRGKFTNLIFLCYWYSPVKPNWEFIFKRMNIRPFLKFDNVNYRITFLQVIADIPAKQHLLNMMNVNGYNSCSDCDIKGQNINRTMTFPHAELIPRDPKTFMVKNKTIQGVKGISVLREYLESFPQGAVIDAMHSVYKGPMEDDLKRLFNGFKFNDTGTRLIKLDKLGKELLEKVLANTTFPKEYQRRRIRPVDMFANWKASELKLFTIYVIPSVFIYLSSSQPRNIKLLLDSMIKYVAAIRLLINSKITPNMISFASALLKDWSSQRAHLWGDKTMTFKTHQALHLTEQVVQHGPLSTHSAFSGESAIGRIGKNISCFSIEVSVKQICERMVMEHASLAWIEEHSQADLKQMFKLTTDNHKRKTQQPSEDVEKFLKLQNIAYVVLGEIVICGFSICFFWKTGSADCYVAMSTTNGYKPLKVMAIIENSTKEILFCCKLLNTKPYSTLMTTEGILASQPLAYE